MGQKELEKMSNLFSNYFGGGGSGPETSRFVGQVVDLGDNHKLKIKKVIAEGMCAVCLLMILYKMAIPTEHCIYHISILRVSY